MPKSKLPQNCLYLVTDSGLLAPSSSSLDSHVEAAIKGGVDIVQLREKDLDTGAFIALATEVLQVCRAAGVPFLINDRVDVALVVGADGVHVGQSDMTLSNARLLLGDDKIIGVSVNTPDEATAAVRGGADYVGIGAVYDTSTKKLDKPTLGPIGVQAILRAIANEETVLGLPAGSIGTVAIGGLNAANIERVMYASSAADLSSDADSTRRRSLDGVALVSAIMCSSTPSHASAAFKRLLTNTPANLPFSPFLPPTTTNTDSFIPRLAGAIRRTVERSPLVHQYTNNVVKNFSANATLAVGGSPVMSEIAEECMDLALARGDGRTNGFLLNMGMVAASLDTAIALAAAHNAAGNLTILDPVGAGATAYRRSAVRKLLDAAYWTVVKGNEGEIRGAAGLPSDMRGVDNVSTSADQERVELARTCAKTWRNIVVITGAVDVVSDGVRTAVVRAGHPFMGGITGSGCSLGSVIASVGAAVGSEEGRDVFTAVVAACTLYKLAGARAGALESCHGPGTFVPHFLDQLYNLAREIEAGDISKDVVELV
ncbi:thiamine biosynthetic bifunctional enzyme [Savitreella phatthalungensis]